MNMANTYSNKFEEEKKEKGKLKEGKHYQKGKGEKNEKRAIILRKPE